ncbi:MAG: alpha/beta fold hydrolase [Patescibacteria group bacterium UBA2163]
MQQVLSIHGGGEFIGYSRDAFLKEIKNKEITLDRLRSKQSWRGNLQKTLGHEYDVLSPRMPFKDAPRYIEWKAVFENIIPLIDDGVILLGHSLGGLFLMKYLAEETIPKKIRGFFSVAAPHIDKEHPRYKDSEFVLPDNLDNIATQVDSLFLYHSTDDPVVPYEHLTRYVERLPKATVRTFDDRHHFIGENFPEVIADIKSVT